MQQFTSLIGIGLLLGIALLLSDNRRHISIRIVWVSLGLQFLIAGLFLAFPPVVRLVKAAAQGFIHILSFTQQGSRFVFGQPLLDPSGPWGFVFAVHVLPAIVFFAALMAVLYHLGIMPRIIQLLAWLLRRSLGVTGSESLAVAANIFLGQTEAPLCVKPYIAGMTRLATYDVDDWRICDSVWQRAGSVCRGSGPGGPSNDSDVYPSHINRQCPVCSGCLLSR